MVKRIYNKDNDLEFDGDKLEKDIEHLAEKFLMESRIEIEDDGFTQRVMQSLPTQVDWQHRLSVIWNCICIVLLFLFCWQTNVFPNLLIDTKVFFQTLPHNIQDVNIWQTIAWFYITIIVLIVLFIKKYEKVF